LRGEKHALLVTAALPTKAYARPAAIVIDELNTSGFERVTNREIVSRIHESFFVSELRPPDRSNANC
jgi:hypothetical protein